MYDSVIENTKKSCLAENNVLIDDVAVAVPEMSSVVVHLGAGWRRFPYRKQPEIWPEYTRFVYRPEDTGAIELR